ncbi:hypothetical protein EFS30_01050 [Levilactobacillus parabrevis]|nr:hypothetical protein [Levilactobacillus parabrevis]MCT4489217.1 hypothetical protein [Levilactobacillus parabrevis]
MTLADDSCQVRSWDELGDVWTLTASSRGSRPFLRLEPVPTAAESLAVVDDSLNLTFGIKSRRVHLCF